MKLLMDDAHVPSFVREARWMNGGTHGVVPLHWFDHTNVRGEPCAALFMPYLREGNLYAKLQLRTYSYLDIIHWLTSISESLRTLGCVHRDIKPENILFFDGQPLIADFGLAVHGSPTERSEWGERITSTGSPFYMSPEQHRNLQDLDFRSDMYALGIMFYELWTGDLPYKASLEAKELFFRKYDGLELADLRDPEANAFVQKALRYSRAERYQTWDAFIEALHRIRSSLRTPVNLSTSQ